jgi:phthalate 4,5-dioxygenase oxygenase subunit
MTTAIENQELTQVSAGTVMGDLFRLYWLPVAMSSELPFAGCPPIRVRVLGEDLVAFRTGNGELGLTDEFCAHRRASLFHGRVSDCGITCLYHGWEYGPDGQCLDTPNEPRERFKESVRVTAYPCREIGQMLWAYMGPADLMPEPPEFEFAMVPDDSRYLTKRVQESNWLQAVEGNLDGSHVATLHSDFHFWFPELPGKPPAEVSVTIAKQTSSFLVEKTDYGVVTGVVRDHPKGGSSWRFNHILMPCFQLVAPDPQIDPNHMCHIMVPIDDYSTWVFTLDYNSTRPITAAELDYYHNGGGIQPELIPGTPVAVQNRSNDYLVNRDLQRSDPSMTGIRPVAAQDAAMQESMGPIVPREEEHLCGTDIAVVTFRRLLLDSAHDYRDSATLPPGRVPVTQRVRAQSAVVPKDFEDWVAESHDYTTAQGPYYDALVTSTP